MIEFLASRWGRLPWELDVYPIVLLRHWFDVAIKNAMEEKELEAANMAGSILKGL